MNKISCIICAFNEETRISVVLTALFAHPLIEEVIVVNDGSTDSTKKIVEQSKWVKLISHEKNLGKSQAMCAGIQNSQNDLLMFLDADLKNITKDDITALAMPILENKSDITISVRKNSFLLYRIMGLDFVSGERVISKKYLINYIKDIRQLPSYGVEVFINKIIIRKKLRVKMVNWKNVSIINKVTKVGFWKGVKGEIRMIKDICKVISFKEILSQNYQLIKLSKPRVD